MYNKPLTMRVNGEKHSFMVRQYESLSDIQTDYDEIELVEIINKQALEDVRNRLRYYITDGREDDIKFYIENGFFKEI